MLKGKEVISDPQLQYETTRKIHVETHGGINKTTAAVAEKYHWIRIKETASQVIKNCPLCLAASTPSARNATQPERRGPGGTWTLGHFYPFDREYSVPPGDSWLGSYGQLKDQFPQTPAAPPPEVVELPPMEVDADADAEVEHEAESSAVQGNDVVDGIFRGGNIPVDPALMDGMDALDEARYFLDSQADAQLQTEAAQATRDADGSDLPMMKPPKRPARGKRGPAEITEAEVPSVGRSVRSKRGASTVSETPSVGQKTTPQKHSKEKQQKHVPYPTTETSSEAVSMRGSGGGSKLGRGRPRKSAKGGKEAS
jgi:hypothetical protein